MLIIDPQNDFTSKQGALYVPGADEDMGRLGKFIIDNLTVIRKLYVTLDSHSNYHIAHGNFWRDIDGKEPEPYTIITKEDVENRRWIAKNVSDRDWSVKYLNSLHNHNRYNLCIWPKHCIVGTNGHAINEHIVHALNEYETNTYINVKYVIKSNNSLTEHYSALRADVPYEGDSTTFFNRKLYNDLMSFDKVIITGEALSHCVANTIIDIAKANNEDLSSIILLSDTTSNVAGCENLGEEFIKYATSKGMQIATTETFKEFIG